MDQLIKESVQPMFDALIANVTEISNEISTNVSNEIKLQVLQVSDKFNSFSQSLTQDLSQLPALGSKLQDSLQLLTILSIIIVCLQLFTIILVLFKKAS
jgi:hypothetical protein